MPLAEVGSGDIVDPRQELEKLDRQWVEKSELRRSAARQGMLVMTGYIAMMVGLGLVVLGSWLNDLGEDVRLERLLHPWPFVSMVLGVCVILGSLVVTLRNARQIKAYTCAKTEYESRRDELLQEIYASKSDLESCRVGDPDQCQFNDATEFD